MKDTIKCFIGVHDLDIIKEEPFYGPHNVEIGTLYTLKCKRCGSIKTKVVYKYNNYR